jgi:hypothetical protein
MQKGTPVQSVDDFRESLRDVLVTQVVNWQGVMTPLMRGKQMLSHLVQPLLMISDDYRERPDLIMAFNAFLKQVQIAARQFHDVLSMAHVVPDPSVGILAKKPKHAVAHTAAGGRSEGFSSLRRRFGDPAIASVLARGGVSMDGQDYVVDVARWGLCVTRVQNNKQYYIVIPDCRSSVLLFGNNIVNLDLAASQGESARILEKMPRSKENHLAETLEPEEFKRIERSSAERYAQRSTFVSPVRDGPVSALGSSVDLSGQRSTFGEKGSADAQGIAKSNEGIVRDLRIAEEKRDGEYQGKEQTVEEGVEGRRELPSRIESENAADRSGVVAEYQVGQAKKWDERLSGSDEGCRLLDDHKVTNPEEKVAASNPEADESRIPLNSNDRATEKPKDKKGDNHTSDKDYYVE